MKYFDQKSILEAEDDFRRNLINSLTGFKSLNLIGTQSNDGNKNLAPFSQVFHVGATPPLVGILFRPHTVERHTLENIFETEYFTLNHVLPSFYKAAHQTAARYAGSEFEATGLDPVYLNGFFAPYVAQSQVKSGCKLVEFQTLKSNGTVLIIGNLTEIWVAEKGLGPDGMLDLNHLETVTVTGLDCYHVGKKLARLSYPKPDREPKEI